MADGSVVISVDADVSGFEKAAAKLENDAAALSAKISESIAGGLSDIGSESLVPAMDAVASSLIDAASSASACAASAFLSADWSGTGGTAVSDIARGFGGAVGHLASAAKSAADTAKSAFSADWASAGRAAADGIADGIRSGESVIEAAAASAASAALESARRELDINSPSKVMRDRVGLMIPLGIAEGILDGGDYVRDAVKNVTEKSYGTYNQTINLRDGDSSPYRTVKRIKRESEVLFRK